MVNITLPRIVAYWTGYEKLDFNPGAPDIPGYVKNIDVLILAFCLVKNNTIVYTCMPSETCLCNGKQYWSQTQILQWLGKIKKACPRIRILLSVGGWAFNNWTSVTSVSTFASNVVGKLTEWSGLVDGLDIDYELGSSSTTPLPANISFHSVISALINKLAGSLPVNSSLSLPYYGGSPWAPSDLADLKDNISFVSTMGYGEDTTDYQALLSAGFRAVNGISSQWQVSAVAPFIKENNIQAAMFWNLCEAPNDPPSAFIEALNQSLPVF